MSPFLLIRFPLPLHGCSCSMLSISAHFGVARDTTDSLQLPNEERKDLAGSFKGLTESCFLSLSPGTLPTAGNSSPGEGMRERGGWRSKKTFPRQVLIPDDASADSGGALSRPVRAVWKPEISPVRALFLEASFSSRGRPRPRPRWSPSRSCGCSFGRTICSRFGVPGSRPSSSSSPSFSLEPHSGSCLG